MRISRDRRPIAKQAKSGLKIAGAMVASLTALALTAISYELIVDLDGSHHVVLGWLLMCAVAAVLAMTAQYWRHWFYFLPGYVMMRSLLWVFFGWFSPKGYLIYCLPPPDGGDGWPQLSIQPAYANLCHRPDRSYVSLGMLDWLYRRDVVTRTDSVRADSGWLRRFDSAASMECDQAALRH